MLGGRDKIAPRTAHLRSNQQSPRPRPPIHAQANAPPRPAVCLPLPSPAKICGDTILLRVLLMSSSTSFTCTSLPEAKKKAGPGATRPGRLDFRIIFQVQAFGCFFTRRRVLAAFAGFSLTGTGSGIPSRRSIMSICTASFSRGRCPLLDISCMFVLPPILIFLTLTVWSSPAAPFPVPPIADLSTIPRSLDGVSAPPSSYPFCRSSSLFFFSASGLFGRGCAVFHARRRSLISAQSISPSGRTNRVVSSVFPM